LITGARAPGLRAGHSFAPRISCTARLRLCGARLCHRSLHLGVSRGDLGAHPRCSDSPPRSIRKGRSAAHAPIGLRPLHLSGTRLEGGHQGLSRRYGGVDGEPLRGDAAAFCRCRNTRATRKQSPVPACRTPPCAGAASWRGCARCCVHWLDSREPQGPEESSVPTLEASSAQVSGRRPYKTWAAKAAFRSERGGLSEQRGWAPKALRRDAQAHRRLRAATPKPTEGSAPRHLPKKKAARRRPVDSPWRGERREPFANQTIRSGSGRRQPVR